MKLQDAIAKIRTVAELLPEDDPDKAEMLETEGDYATLMDKYLSMCNERAALADACKRLAEMYRERGTAMERKCTHLRGFMEALMGAADETKYTGAAGTVSLRRVPPKPFVIEETLVPEEFWRVKREINKTAINEAVKAGQTVPGVGMDNGGTSITVRMK